MTELCRQLRLGGLKRRPGSISNRAQANGDLPHQPTPPPRVFRPATQLGDQTLL